MTRSTKLRKIHGRIARAAGAGLWLALFVAPLGCKSPPAAAGEAAVPPIHVDTVEVREQSMPRSLQLTGTLHGKQQTDLAANASGRVVATFVERGAEVKKGDLLATLDVRAAALMATEARASAELARTAATTAQRECERYQKLLDQNAISSAEYDRVSDQCRTSSMTIEAAQARAQQAAQVLGDGAIRAPFGGVVAERYVEAGAYVRPDTRVVSLVAVDALRVEFSVPEQHLGAVKAGGALTFTVPSYPDRIFAATVRYVGASVREATRDLVAEALVDNADRALRPGMFANVSLITGEGPLPVVPKACLLDKDGRAHLFVVVEQHLEERVAQTGVVQGDVIAVLRGVKAGDRVVAAPTELLRNGQPVN